MVCLIDKKQWILKHTVFSSPPSGHRSSEQSIVPNLLSVEQKQSAHILCESRPFKHLSPHISPTTRAEICCKVPIFPDISLGSPPRGSRWQVHYSIVHVGWLAYHLWRNIPSDWAAWNTKKMCEWQQNWKLRKFQFLSWSVLKLAYTFRTSVGLLTQAELQCVYTK